ncbi:MAG: acyl carrier protein [Actinomycetaceae bacterium]|nr:acyl carrier protein [Actinomycetaceae bacterium]
MPDFPSDADPCDIALAYIRVELAEIAPEIASEEIIPSAVLRNGLGLDELSVWALAVALEKSLKTEFVDQAISGLRTVADLVDLVLSEPNAAIPHFHGHDREKTQRASRDNKESGSAKEDLLTHSTDMASAIADLAKLFDGN